MKKYLLIAVSYNWVVSFVLALISVVWHLISFSHTSHIAFVIITIYFLISTFLLAKVFFSE